MGAIKTADNLARAQQVLGESTRIGEQTLSIASQVNQLATQFLAIKAEAADAEDSAVFDKRMAEVMGKARASLSNIPADRRALIQQVVHGLFD